MPVEDPGALAVAIAAALLDEPARRREGEAVRARALAGFTFERTVGAIEVVYDAVLDERV